MEKKKGKEIKREGREKIRIDKNQTRIRQEIDKK